jgi:hypothetical protein
MHVRMPRLDVDMILRDHQQRETQSIKYLFHQLPVLPVLIASRGCNVDAKATFFALHDYAVDCYVASIQTVCTQKSDLSDFWIQRQEDKCVAGCLVVDRNPVKCFRGSEWCKSYYPRVGRVRIEMGEIGRSITIRPMKEMLFD